MDDISQQLTGVLRVFLAALFGAAIGNERERQSKPAGLRTHILVCLGASLFTYAGMTLGGEEHGRVAAGVVTGVGFLGAGAILRQERGVSGLTTAAGIWAAAAIGLATGAGLSLLAAATTLIVVLTLRLRTRRERAGGGETDEE